MALQAAYSGLENTRKHTKFLTEPRNIQQLAFDITRPDEIARPNANWSYLVVCRGALNHKCPDVAWLKANLTASAAVTLSESLSEVAIGDPGPAPWHTTYQVTPAEVFRCHNYSLHAQVCI